LYNEICTEEAQKRLTTCCEIGNYLRSTGVPEGEIVGEVGYQSFQLTTHARNYRCKKALHAQVRIQEDFLKNQKGPDFLVGATGFEPVTP